MRIGYTPSPSFNWYATENHRALPGFIRAALVDHGIASGVIDRRLIGWDGAFVTVPVADRSGRAAFFERWDPLSIGTPVDRNAPVELYPLDVLSPPPPRLLIAEGVHEALVLESQGFASVTATGTGLVFKSREWAALLARVPGVLLAYRRGERRERRHHLLSRRGVVAKAVRALPHARRLAWPDSVGKNGGAYAFFVEQGRTREEFTGVLTW